MPDYQPGDKVLYVPAATAAEDHGLDTDGREFCFHFRHLEDGHRGTPEGPKKHARGDRAHVPVTVPGPDGAPKFSLTRVNGVLHTHDGHPVEPHEPKAFWPAAIAEVHGDGSYSIDIRHPHGETLHYRRRPSDTKEPGTFHREGKADA